MGSSACGHVIHYQMTMSLGGNTLFSPVVKFPGVSQIFHFLRPFGLMALHSKGTGRFALKMTGGDYQAPSWQQHSNTSSTFWLCEGELAPLSLISRAEKLLFIARLFLPLYFCPSCCQQILAGISIAVLN